MTFRHRAGVSPYTSACAFAETCVLGKQSLGPIHCDRNTFILRLPFSLSYGVILPSSLTRVIPFVLQFSCRLPVSVCGTGASQPFLADFLASVNSSAFPAGSALMRARSLPTLSASPSGRGFPSPRSDYPSVSLHRTVRRYRNIHVYLLSINYAFRPRLRSRLTPGGRTFPGNP